MIWIALCFLMCCSNIVHAQPCFAGSCVEGLWAIMFSGHSSKERNLDRKSHMPCCNILFDSATSCVVRTVQASSGCQGSAHPQEIPVLVDTPIKDAAYPDSDSETSSTMTRVSTRSCTDCESNA